MSYSVDDAEALILAAAPSRRRGSAFPCRAAGETGCIRDDRNRLR